MRRRQFLGAMALTGALPYLGCGRAPAREVAGRIVGASHKVGHRLREGKFPAPTRTVKVHTAILGGGIAGLSAAWKLQRSGLDDFQVFELESDLGGNSRSARYGPGLSAPWAAHYLPVPTKESRVVREVLQEMGMLTGYDAAGRPLYREEDLCHDPEERIFAHGAWEEGLYPRFGSSPEDARQLEEFLHHVDGWKAWRDKAGRKAFAIPLELSSQDPEVLALDRVSMLQYMEEKKWTSPRLRWFVEYGCRDDYGTSLAGTSAWAGLHYFASRDGGGFEPRDAQFVWPEGNQRLAAHFMHAVGARHSKGCLVIGVAPGPHGVVCDLYEAARDEVVRVECRNVLFCLPSFLRPFLGLPRVGPLFSYSPWVVANLLLDTLPAELPGRRPGLHWDNVIYDSPSLGYVVSTHQQLGRLPHPTVLTWYQPFVGLDALAERRFVLEKPWTYWRDTVLNELRPLHPGLQEILARLDVMLLGHAMVRPVPGFIWGEDRRQAQQPLPRVFFAHSDLSGISIFEQASFQGVRAAQRLMDSLGHPYQDSLDPIG